MPPTRDTAPDSPPPPADGHPASPAARTFDSFVRLLEDGALNAELSDQLRAINEDLNQHAIAYGGKPKAKLTIDIDFTMDGGVFMIQSRFKTKLPEAPRARTIAWGTAAHDFTPNNPKQGQLFGVRDPAGDGAVRDA